MEMLFSDVPESVTNTVDVAARCEVELPHGQSPTIFRNSNSRNPVRT